MASSTEQNLVSVPPTVVVIKLPDDLEQRLLCFPFLHHLVEHYENFVIHLISTRHHLEVLNLLPFKAFYHEWDDDHKYPWDVYRSYRQLNIPKVDVFLNLSKKTIDGFLGLFFRAKIRCGFLDGYKKYFHNQGVLIPTGQHYSQQYLELLKAHTQVEIDKNLRVYSRDLKIVSNSKEDPEELPLIIINIGIFDETIDTFWEKTISLITKPLRIIFVVEENEENFLIYFPIYQTKFPMHHKIEFFTSKDWIILSKQMIKAQGILSVSGSLGLLGSYLNVTSLLFYYKQDPQMSGPFYFFSDSKIFFNPGLIQTENLDQFNPELVAQDLLSFFRIG